MHPRHITPLLRASLEHFPAVLLTGARQVGKSTLVQMLAGEHRITYRTLDDRVVLDAALRDPDGFIAGHPDPLILDEIQRAPDLLRAIKLAVDRDRRPGRFLLTGSANVVTLARVSETLAGRVALHELFPFSFAESQERQPTAVLDILFAGENVQGVRRSFVQEGAEHLPRLPQEHILHGGYPTPCLEKNDDSRRRWFASYRTTYVERDVRDIRAIEHLSDFHRLLTAAAARTGQLVNFADVGRDAGIPYATLRRYMQMLEQTYQVCFVPPFFANVPKRLVKSPKLYVSDTGMACALLGIDRWQTLEAHGRVGAMVETWVAAELRKMIAVSRYPLTLYGWREYGGAEVDFLMCSGDRFVAIEVTHSSRIDHRKLVALDRLRSALGNRLICEIVLYGGSDAIALDDRRLAVPLTFFFAGRRRGGRSRRF